MIFISEENELKIKKPYTAIYFYADWLLFHKKMLIMISKIEQMYPDLNFFCVDVDFFKGLCKKYLIESIPTVIIFNSSEKEINRIVGLPLTKAFKNAFVDINK